MIDGIARATVAVADQAETTDSFVGVLGFSITTGAETWRGAPAGRELRIRAR